MTEIRCKHCSNSTHYVTIREAADIREVAIATITHWTSGNAKYLLPSIKFGDGKTGVKIIDYDDLVEHEAAPPGKPKGKNNE